MTNQRLYLTIAEKILELINSGVFPVGSRLPGERDLATRFGVSRVAVREAEIALQAQGRLEVKIGSGAYVLDGKKSSANSVPEVGPFELTEARALFEAESAALAAPIITDEAIAELERLIEVMISPESSDFETDEADEAFHVTIAKATNNAAIIYVISTMWKMCKKTPQIQKVCRSVCSKDSTHLEDEHQAILIALKNRDSAAARTAMRIHFTRLIEALLIASEEAAYQEVKKRTSESRSRFLLASQLD